ncbi:MAG: hypothetical protein ACK4PR_08200 [Gammaproteobacteria bacterium]
MKSRVFIKIVSTVLGTGLFSGTVLAVPAGPQLVSDPKLTQEETTEWAYQIKDMGTELDNWSTQLSTMDNQYSELQYQAKDLDREVGKLTNFQNYSVQDEINDLNSFLHTSTNLEKNFQEYHPGYQATNSNSNNSVLINNTMNTLQGSVNSLSSNATESNKESDALTKMQNDASSATGTTSAMQAEAELTSAEIAQLQLLRQAVLAESSAQVATESYEVQKDASSQATQDKIIQAGDMNVTGNLGGYPLEKPIFH